MFGTNITLLPYKHKYIEIPHDKTLKHISILASKLLLFPYIIKTTLITAPIHYCSFSHFHATGPDKLYHIPIWFNPLLLFVTIHLFYFVQIFLIIAHVWCIFGALDFVYNIQWMGQGFAYPPPTKAPKAHEWVQFVATFHPHSSFTIFLILH